MKKFFYKKNAQKTSIYSALDALIHYIRYTGHNLKICTENSILRKSLHRFFQTCILVRKNFAAYNIFN